MKGDISVCYLKKEGLEKIGRPMDLSRNRVIIETTIELVAEDG